MTALVLLALIGQCPGGRCPTPSSYAAPVVGVPTYAGPTVVVHAKTYGDWGWYGITDPPYRVWGRWAKEDGHYSIEWRLADQPKAAPKVEAKAEPKPKAPPVKVPIPQAEVPKPAENFGLKMDELPKGGTYFSTNDPNLQAIVENAGTCLKADRLRNPFKPEIDTISPALILGAVALFALAVRSRNR